MGAQEKTGVWRLLIGHWGSGIPRIIGKVKAAGLREPEFIGGEVDLRINIYRGGINDSDCLNRDMNDPNSAGKVPKKCRIVNRNDAFMNMCWKTVL